VADPESATIGRWARAGACLAFLAATFFSVPQLVGGRALDLGLALGFVAPACFFFALRGLAPRAALGLGLLVGFAAYASLLHWLYVIVTEHVQGRPGIGVAAVAIFGGYSALGSALVGGAGAVLAARGRATPLRLAALWVAADHLRAVLFSGFPWVTLGYSQHQNAWLLGLAPWTGVYGLSFAAALGGAGLAALAGGERRRAALALAGVAALHGLGALSLALGGDDSADGRLRVAVAQGNIGQRDKWDQDRVPETLEIYAALSRSARADGAELVVWPETAIPGSPQVGPALAQWLSDFTRDTGLLLVTGAVGVERVRPDSDELRYLDSAYAYASGTLLDRYDKVRLVPFGEFIPFAEVLGRIYRPIATGMAQAGVSPGAENRVVVLPLPDGRELRVGIPICYELLFPDTVRRFAAAGAQLLLGITNDVHFGRTGGPYQFLAMSSLRAAETGLWMARAANSGVSAVIDPRGRVRAATPLFERTALAADVPLRPPHAAPTFYARHGDVFARLAWLGLGLALIGPGVARWLRAAAAPE
jgi:apolipoprotein N-acyltransferase